MWTTKERKKSLLRTYKIPDEQWGQPELQSSLFCEAYKYGLRDKQGFAKQSGFGLRLSTDGVLR
jgi:hypothetical protein